MKTFRLSRYRRSKRRVIFIRLLLSPIFLVYPDSLSLSLASRYTDLSQIPDTKENRDTPSENYVGHQAAKPFVQLVHYIKHYSHFEEAL